MGPTLDVRLGPTASGALSQILKNPLSLPPARRKTTPREILEFFRAITQIGFPALMHTDACFGYSAMGYQGWEVAHGLCEASKFTLIRLVGPASEGHDAKNNLAQKVKVGFCSCCSQATHLAVPSSSKLGAYSELEGLGMRLWADERPWEGRRLAAVNYVLDPNGSP